MVYCVFEFFQVQGFVYWIELFNVFVGCYDFGKSYVVQFMICCECCMVVEIYDLCIVDVFMVVVVVVGFMLQECVVEFSGLCVCCVLLCGELLV